MRITGLAVDGGGFEILNADQRIGPRRSLTADDLTFLNDLAARYQRAVRDIRDDRQDVFIRIGRDLWTWLDGDHRQLSGLVDQAAAPLVFEIRGARRPDASGWAMLNAPWELLAQPAGSFLAEDVLTRFSVIRRLGAATEPPPLDDYRLGLAFMASSPRGQHELDFESEEAAIMASVGNTRVDLMVDDSGNPEQLCRRLADLDGLPVLHLSCHGTNHYPGLADSVLLMENEFGAGRPTTAAELVQLLTRNPRLIFVSACLTGTAAPPAAEEAVAHSFASALVTAGQSAVLGWDGSVGDRAATGFATKLYADLGNRERVDVAIGNAQRVLLQSQEPEVRAYWHLARVWLGPAGGGALVGGTKRRLLKSATEGTKTFLDRKDQVPVASAEMFVGRRRELQRALRALSSGEHVGVLLQGQGRLGKSSLAARIADRRPDLDLAVVFGDYSPLAILDAVARAVRTNRDARELIDRSLPRVRENPEELRSVLIDLLSGPCAQVGGTARPLLLVIDDLEQILESNPGSPHRVVADHAAALAAVLDAFDPSETESRLLLTSRYTFGLNGLERKLDTIQLPPLSRVAQGKLHQRQKVRASERTRRERGALAERAVEVCRGNPGLQDLACLRLVYGDDVPLDRAETTVTAMEDYLQQGDLPDHIEVRDFLENLALDALLAEAGAANVELLRALTLFELPVPTSVVEALAADTGGTLSRLRGLGLVDPYQDLYDSSREAWASNPLASGRISPITDAERSRLATLVATPLLGAWGGTDPEPRRWGDLDRQLAVIGIAADDPEVAAATAANAVDFLFTGRASHAAQLGLEAIAVLDRHGHLVPSYLLRTVARASLRAGDGDAGDALLARAKDVVSASDGTGFDRAGLLLDEAERRLSNDTEQARSLAEEAHDLFAAAGDDKSAAIAKGLVADVHYVRGEYDEALRIRHEVELPVYERLGDVRSAAVTWGKIADIHDRRGEYDEALRIHREVTLPVYERLGDVHETAIAWGKVADIHYFRGEYDEALGIHREVTLPVYERLGDVRSAAVTWGKIADIHYQRGEYDEALRIHREATLPIYERLGDTRSAALAWTQIADIHYQRGEYDEASRIRREVTLPVYERLGDVRSAAVTWGQIADIHYQRGEYDEAFRIRRDVTLPVCERLGDVRSAAVTWGQIADIHYQRGEYDEAFRIYREVTLPVCERLGDVRSAAVAWGKIADIHYQRGEYDEAFRIYREVTLPVYERLGDVRSAVLAWGKIADIHYQRGEYDEALRIRREVTLPVYERRGDVRSAAVTWGQIADIDYQRGECDEALRVRREVELPLYDRLGDVRSAALVWGKIADIHYQRGEYDEAFRIRREVMLPVYERLGDRDGIARASWGIAQILLEHDDPEDALPMLARSYQLNLELQRPDGIAVVGDLLGRILLSEGDEQARDVLTAAGQAARMLGWEDRADKIEGLLPPPNA